MKIKHKRVCNTPDTGDTSLIQPSDWNQDHDVLFDVIDTDTTYQINADGTGSFVSLKECIDYLNTMVIHPANSVTINMGPGVHVQPGPVNDTNPGAIYLRGDPSLPVVITTTAVSGTADNWSVVYTIAGGVFPDVAAGMFLTIHNNTSDWPAGFNHFGCHEITAVTTTTVTCKVKNRGTPQTVSGVIIYGTIIKTVVKAGFIGTHLFAMSSGGAKGAFALPYALDICFNGNSTIDNVISVSRGTKAQFHPGYANGYRLAIVNAVDTLLSVYEGSGFFCYDGNVCISGAGNCGVLSAQYSVIDVGMGVIVTAVLGGNNWGRGLHCDSGFIKALKVITVGNRYTAISAFGSVLRYISVRDDAWGSSGALAYKSGVVVDA